MKMCLKYQVAINNTQDKFMKKGTMGKQVVKSLIFHNHYVVQEQLYSDYLNVLA